MYVTSCFKKGRAVYKCEFRVTENTDHPLEISKEQLKELS